MSYLLCDLRLLEYMSVILPTAVCFAKSILTTHTTFKEQMVVSLSRGNNPGLIRLWLVRVS